MATAPTAPITDVWPQCSAGQIHFFWNNPSTDGGSPITKYTLSCTALSYSQDISATRLDHTVTGLTDETDYAFTITATNAIGTSPAASFPVVQAGTQPFGPATATVSTLNVSTALVSWTPSTLTTEGALRAYLVQVLPSTPAISSYFVTTFPFKSTMTVTGLSTNNYYQFLVRGVNDVGYCEPFAYTSVLGFGITSNTGGLLVSLDAGNPASYSGTGSTWTDLTGGGHNATLLNTPTYSSSNSGYLNFAPASLEYARLSNLGNLSNWTVETWVRVTASLTGRVAAIVANEFDLSTKLNFSLGTNRAPTSYNLCAGFYDAGGWHTTTGFAPTLNTWYQIVGTYNGTSVVQYVNGASNSGLSYSGTPQSGGEVRIARRWDETQLSSNFMPADIAVVRIYNRALTSGEVGSNFDELRGRYGL
jgi:hypothetical protein